jgi:hypothetical protein
VLAGGVSHPVQDRVAKVQVAAVTEAVGTGSAKAPTSVIAWAYPPGWISVRPSS